MLRAIQPFFIVDDLELSLRYYVDRLGFQVDFQLPKDDPFVASVSRDGVGILLKAIVPEVRPLPNRDRHEWARWDAFIRVEDPDSLHEEFVRRSATLTTGLSELDPGLRGFEVEDADGYVLAFATTSPS